MLTFVFVLLFSVSSTAVEVVPPFVAEKDVDISTPGDEGCVTSKPVFSKPPRLRQLKGKMIAGMVQGHETRVEYGHPAAGQIPHSSTFFPQEDLFKLQKVFRR